MVHGFAGGPAIRYIEKVVEALEASEEVLQRDPFAGLGNLAVTPPRVQVFERVRSPYDVADVRDGSGRTDVGNSSNVVLPTGGYDDDRIKLQRADYEFQGSIRHIIGEIRGLLADSLRMPKIVALLDVTLESYQRLAQGSEEITGETISLMRGATEEILGLGGGSPGAFAWNEAVGEDARRECELAMRRQVELLQDTARDRLRLLPGLEASSRSEAFTAQSATREVVETDWQGNRRRDVVPDWDARNTADRRARSLDEQIGLLEGNARLLEYAARELEEQIDSSRRLFQRQLAETQGVDDGIANSVRGWNQQANYLALDLEAIADSIHICFPLPAGVDLPQQLAAKLVTTVSLALVAAWRAGRPRYCELGGDPVNLATGNFVYSTEDIRGLGRCPLSLVRCYNSLGGSPSGPLGQGWTHNYNIHLCADDEQVHVTLGDGRIETFTKIGDRHLAPAGSDFLLLRDRDAWRLVSDSKIHLFNAEGQITAISGRNGTQADFEYSDGLLKKVSTVSGCLLVEYEEERLSLVQDQGGRQVVFEYVEGRLVGVSDAVGGTTRYEYDEHGRLFEIIDPLGVTAVRNEYDHLGRVARQWLPGEREFQYWYDTRGRETTLATPDGAKTIYAHDEQYRTTTVLHQGGASEHRDYNLIGQAVSKTDKNGKVRTFAYTDSGQPAGFTDALGYRTVLEYDGPYLSRVIREDRVLQEFVYDEQGNTIEARDALGRATRTDYNNAGQPVKVTLPDGSSSATEYDERGNVIVQTDAQGESTKFEYNNLNQVVSVTYPEGGVERLTYTRSGMLSTVTSAEGLERQFSYNSNGQLVEMKDPGGTITYAYNQIGKIEKIVGPDGEVTLYAYDAAGNTTSVISPDGNMARYAYNESGKLVLSTAPDGTTAEYEYDHVGNITAVNTSDGGWTTHLYDALGRLTNTTMPDGNAIERTYDAFGNITKIVTPDGVMTREFDPAGQLVKAVTPNGHVYDLAYTPLGQLARIAASDGRSQTFTYHPGGRLKETQLTPRAVPAAHQPIEVSGLITPDTKYFSDVPRNPFPIRIGFESVQPNSAYKQMSDFWGSRWDAIRYTISQCDPPPSPPHATEDDVLNRVLSRHPRPFLYTPYPHMFIHAPDRVGWGVLARPRDVTDAINPALRDAVLEAYSRRPVRPSGWNWINPFAHAGYELRRGANMLWLATEMRPRGPWDVKVEERFETQFGIDPPQSIQERMLFRGYLFSSEHMGNWFYGYIGAALGLEIDLLLAGSWVVDQVVSPGPLGLTENEWLDWWFIMSGFLAFDIGNHLCQ